jgi:D-lactate dehydrogenase
MLAIKHLFDPAGVLNPGVLISDDPDEHLRNLKLMPRIEPEFDGCIECGYCEVHTPRLSLTPRQQIVLRRELAARQDDEELVAAVTDGYADYATRSATPGGACPLGIDTDDVALAPPPGSAGTLLRATRTTTTRTVAAVALAGAAAFTAARSAVRRLRRRDQGSP